MPYFAIAPSPPSPPQFKEDSTPFRRHLTDDTTALSSVPPFKSPSARRSYFANKLNRRAIPYHPSDVITTDFCYGFLSFPEIRLNLPGGISFDLMNYWDGQPVRFVCCERRREGGHEGDSSTSSASSVSSFDTEGGKRKGGRSERKARGGLKGPGDPFWVVVFEAVVDDHEEEEVSGSSSAVTPDEEVPLRVSHPNVPEQVDNGTVQKGANELEDQAHLREDID
jgi:hypothetical protein